MLGRISRRDQFAIAVLGLIGAGIPLWLSAAAGALLRTLNPGFQDSWVTNAWSFAAPYAQPIVDTTYRRRMPGFSTDVPGLYNASMFQVYPHDRGQNYSVELAHRLVSFLDSPVR